MPSYTIVPFRPEHAQPFHDLNVEWLEKYFVVEPIDSQVLSNPQAILDQGGEILVCERDDGLVAGVVSLMQESPGVFELTKMAVAPCAQGLGLGRELINAAIERFVKRNGTQLFLESNSKLVPAITLYETAGFVHQPSIREGSHYNRANVYMIWKPVA